jgi:DNA-directed RNA polymerase subunit RPC12/RpoP
MKKGYLPQWDNTKQTAKVKAKCTHCGKKQTAEEVNYSLNYAVCTHCGKQGELITI